MLNVGQTVRTSYGEEFEVYNVTEGMVHMAKIDEDGNRLPATNKNLLNLKDDQVLAYLNKGILEMVNGILSD